jgi:hypothetical protein
MAINLGTETKNQKIANGPNCCLKLLSEMIFQQKLKRKV